MSFFFFFYLGLFIALVFVFYNDPNDMIPNSVSYTWPLQ
jgi:hypothetical protein